MAFSDLQKYALGSAGTGLLSGVGSLFFNKNPAKDAQPYLNQITPSASPYYQPYYNYGVNTLPSLNNEYQGLLSNPGGKLNEIGESFHQSPGFEFALKRALQSASNAASAGGYGTSPQHAELASQTATNLANQDYYNWLGQATGLYGKGLGLGEDIMRGGQEAGKNMADLIAQQLAAQSKLAYEGRAQKNQNLGNGISQIAGSLLPLAFSF